MNKTSTAVADARPVEGTLDRVKAGPGRAKRLLERARARSKVVDVTVRTVTRYSEDDCGSYAAALTYFAFFAIFPLLLFAAAGIGYLTFGNEQLAERVVTAGVKGVPMIEDALTRDGLRVLQENKDTIAGVGLALALYTGTGMIVALGHSLNKVHRVESEGTWFRKRISAIKWLVILGIAAAGSVAMASVAAAVPGLIGTVLGFGGALMIDLLIFATAFKFLPARNMSWREVMAGAAVAAVAFSALKGFGAAYLAQGQGARNATYGTLAGAATLLVASYLISQVILLAAEVNATLIERRTTRTKASERTEEGA